jgi:starch synthase
VGGLADVAGALPKALRALGHDVRVVTPRHGTIDGARFGLRDIADGLEVVGSAETASLSETDVGGVATYFVGNDRYFGRDGVYGFSDDVERYLFFCRAALIAPERLDWTPDVVHSHDWHAAIIPHWLKTGHDLPAWGRDAASVHTIHNLAYQGGFHPNEYPMWIDTSVLHRRENGSYDLLSQGISSADILTTVSERYAQEITTPEYGEGLEGLLASRQARLRGIINGIDYEVFNPATDPAITQSYSGADLSGKAVCKEALQREEGFDVAPTTPLIGLIGRLADQKGFDLVAVFWIRFWPRSTFRLSLVIGVSLA